MASAAVVALFAAFVAVVVVTVEEEKQEADRSWGQRRGELAVPLGSKFRRAPPLLSSSFFSSFPALLFFVVIVDIAVALGMTLAIKAPHREDPFVVQPQPRGLVGHRVVQADEGRGLGLGFFFCMCVEEKEREGERESEGGGRGRGFPFRRKRPFVFEKTIQSRRALRT